MESYILYDILKSPDFYKIKLVDNKKNIVKKVDNITKKCWYCESNCHTFVSICDLCRKYRHKK
jgi:hypothetical protein